MHHAIRKWRMSSFSSLGRGMKRAVWGVVMVNSDTITLAYAMRTLESRSKVMESEELVENLLPGFTTQY